MMKLKFKYNSIFVVLSLILAMLLMPLKNEVFSSSLNIVLSIIAFTNILVFWKTSSSINNHWIRFEILFLIGYLIVHFQIPFTASLGWEPNDPGFIWINKNVVNYATWLSLISLLFWIFGFLFFGYIFINRKNKRNKYDSGKLNLLKVLNRLKFVLLILFISFVYLVGSDFLSGAYDGGDNWGPGASYVYITLRSIVVIYIIIFFVHYKNQITTFKNVKSVFFKNKIFATILLLYFLIFLLAGDRGPVIETAIVFTFMYSITQIRIKGVTFLLLILFSIITMSILEMGRGRDISNRTESNIISEGYKNFSDKDEFNPTLELASSNRILYRAIDVVPNNHPYLYGSTILSNIISAVPFGARTLTQVFNVPKIYLSSSHFFTFIGQGNYPTWGEGSEIIADLYINLGIYGIIIIMIFFGGLICRLSFFSMYQDNIYILIVYMIFTMSAITLNRAPLFTILQPLFFSTIIYKLITYNARR